MRKNVRYINLGALSKQAVTLGSERYDARVRVCENNPPKNGHLTRPTKMRCFVDPLGDRSTDVHAPGTK